MKVRDQQNSTSQQQTPSSRKSWLASIGAVVVVLLIVGISTALFVSHGTSSHSGTNGSITTAPPPAKQWVNVNTSYLFSTLEAASDNPALLYACASPYPLPPGSSPHNTLLRSSDFGAHWQDLDKQVNLRDFCQFAINPANSNDLYVVTAGTPTGNVTPDVLKHSSDGGKTWNTLQPQIQLNKPTSAAWHVQQLRMVGHDLFGIQWMSPLLGSSASKQVTLPLTHLVHSSDGGKTWTAIDNTLVPATWTIHDYVVDPTNTGTIYESAGPLPHVRQPGVSNSGQATNSELNTSMLTLYKTTDGGAHWQQLLNDLMPSSTLQLASGKPNIVSIGETTTARPLSDASQPQSNALLTARIRVSTDGGATWHQALQIYGGSGFVHGWFSGAAGQLYALIGVTNTTNRMPALAPDSATAIRSYDPATGKWSEITKLPQSGDLQAVTDTGTGKGAVLWLRSFVGGKTALYRYVAG
jgi:hypothetical protein